MGLAAPLIPLFIEMSGANLDPLLQKQLVTTSVYALIIYIGMLSGLALPLLMAMGEQVEEGQSIRVLTIDFLATFCGIIAFPLLFMKFLGLFNTSVAVGLLNFGVFIFVGLKLKPVPKKALIIGTALTFALTLLNIFGAPYLVGKVFG